VNFLRDRSRLLLLVALALGLVVRLGILVSTSHLGTPITDEQQYARLAGSIVAGDGFAWGPGEPTSIRPPLYPALVAGVWAIAGTGSLQAVRLAQIALALATTGLVYLLGARLYGPAVGRVGAAVFWLYPSLVFFNVLILTETLFTLLLVAFVLLAVMLVQSPRASVALLCGATLGLAALTRSVLWPLPLVFCPLVGLLITVPLTADTTSAVRAPIVRRAALPLLVLAGYAVVVAPWAIRNTRLQGVTTIVDTMGGINLRMGNYEYTPEDRMWDAVSLTGTQNWMHGYESPYPGAPVTEGTKDKWAQRKAVEYMRAHPAQTIRRSFIKLADFWGLEREFIAGVQRGIYAPPLWFAALASLCIVGGYILVVIAGVAGLWLSPPRDWRAQIVVLLPLLVILAGHTLAFGHSRYHIPLIPFLGVYGAALATAQLDSLRALRLTSRATVLGATATVTALLAIWIRQVALVDLPRIKALLDHVG